MDATLELEIEELKAELFGSFLLFVQTFFPLVTGKPFVLSCPLGRESHFITIARELTKVARMQQNALIINVPPGHGKSVLLSMFVAWTLAKYPNSQYLYISYSHELASKHTAFIKQIIECRQYRELFGVRVRSDSRAKDHFMTTAGGSVKAFGSSGGVTGTDAGLPHCEHFSGMVIMDDMHKPSEVHSDSTRQTVIQNYRETILQRPRAPNVPMIYIGQRLHEDDLPAYLLSGQDIRQWKAVVLKALDDAGNALYPEVNPKEQLLEQQEKNPYVFASQYQQDPIPSGGALFKEEYFPLLDEDPDMLVTFITADTAETSKTYNDATAFSFWGIYELEEAGVKTGQYGLHWIDCLELRVEPKDLKDAFTSFYRETTLHKTVPTIAAIEKKSTGTTLCSVLSDFRGLQIWEIKRTASSGSKTARFLETQYYIASKLVSLPRNGKHTQMCINHMKKITANESHRFDDIADTLCDAVRLTFIEKAILQSVTGDSGSAIVKALNESNKMREMARMRSYGFEKY